MFSHQLSNLYFSAISCHAVIFSCNAKIISVLRMIGNRGNDSKLLSLHGRFAVIAVLPLQLSVEAPKGGNEEKVGHEPGHRIAETHAEEAESRHEPQAHSAAGYHLHHAREHREIAVAEALYAVTENHQNAEGGVEVVVEPHEHGRIADHLLLARLDEKHHHFVGKRIDDEHGEHEIDQHDFHGRAHPHRDARQRMGPDVLSAVGGHGHADVFEHAGEEILDAERSREGGHIDGAQRIVGTLEHDDADAGNGKLQAHRHPVVEQDADALVVVTPFGAFGDEDVEVPPDVGVAEYHREGL